MHQVQQCWVIGLPDKGLLERIRDYWRHSVYADRVHLRVFSQMDTLRHYVGLQTEVQLLIIDPDWRNEVETSLITNDDQGMTIVELDESSGRNQHLPSSGVAYAVTPYQPLSQLFEQLWILGLSIARISEDPIRAHTSPNDASVWTISSGGGGAGKTTIASHLTHYAQEMGLRVFYWNLDWIHEWDSPTLPTAMSGEARTREGSFSKLIYWLSRKDPSEAIEPDPYLFPMGSLPVETFDWRIRRNEWNELDGPTITKVLNWLKSIGRYDLIVVDTSPGHALADAAVSNSDQVVWVVTDDCSQIGKSELCWKHWGQDGQGLGASTMSRLQVIINRYMGSMLNSFTSPTTVHAYFPYIPQWKQRHRMDQGYGSEVFQAAFRDWIQAAAPWMHERF